MPYVRSLNILALLAAACILEGSSAVEHCTPDNGSGVCPTKNTCCPLLFRHEHSSRPFSSSSPPSQSSGCIPNDMPGPAGVCCNDGTGTGCAPGYACVRDAGGEEERLQQRLSCQREDSAGGRRKDPLVGTMPRYRLCSPPGNSLELIHGLPVHTRGNATARAASTSTFGANDENDDGRRPPEIAYYSSHGDVFASISAATSTGRPGPTSDETASSSSSYPEIRAALIVVHGQGRNADDYYCSATIAASLQTCLESSRSVLVLAPRFLQQGDGNVNLTSGGEPLRWSAGGGDDGTDKAGVWRYGADAVEEKGTVGISSFDVMDAIVEALVDDGNRFPNLERITVAGHSSGGQYVQRWALLSGSKVWDDAPGCSDERHSLPLGGASVHRPRNLKPPHVRAVVANPSSYAYLDGRRFVNGTFRIPAKSVVRDCPNYNQWEWGLDAATDGGGRRGMDDVPYKRRAIQDVGGSLPKLADRYAMRDVVYVSGAADRCNVSGSVNDEGGGGADDWCYSHGLETTCSDNLQGTQRLERSANYFASLGGYFDGRRRRHVHKRVIVPMVGHDHSLIFESDVGLKALFAGHCDDDADLETS